MRGEELDERHPLTRARDALARAAWGEARAGFEEALAARDSAEAWEGLSRATWWLGDEQATFSARGHAFRGHREVGDMCGAARMAVWTAADHLDFRGDDAVASAWLRRGRSLLSEVEGPCPELGYLLLMEADVALLARSDPATAELRAREALVVAGDVGDAGVEVVALAILGWALVASGVVEEGVERLDESAALAIGEVFDDMASPGWALCHTVSACTDVGDFHRAHQWCRALHEWSATWRGRHFFGVCRTAYGEVLATGGDWPTAEEELRSAMDDTRATRPGLVAPTAVRLGRLRVRQGDVVEARALFEGALPLPQAILALGELDLAEGQARAGAEAADRVLRRSGETSVLDRLPALELLACSLAAVADHVAAKSTADRLEREAQRMPTAYLRGRARLVRAQVLAANAEHDDARRAAEDAMDLFGECSAPYESARARLVLAAALRALGRGGRADAEEHAAHQALAVLGVRRSARRPSADELTLREVEVLRLVAQGRNDAQIAEQLFLSAHTVHRHVANIRTKLNVSSRAAAVGHATRHDLL